MNPIAVVVVTLIIACVGYQIWVTWRVVRCEDYTKAQRTIQAILVWALPLFGALIAHLVVYSSTTAPRKRDKDFIPEDNAMS